tara:strand:+ start:868 stop:1131 length:264 start_codon:yes stop_codon:yes gene_type:complete
LIRFQNRCEREFSNQKTFYSAFLCFLAFLTFLTSNVIALARFPFVAFQNVRPERQSKLGKVNELNMELVDKDLEQRPVVLLMFGSEW